MRLCSTSSESSVKSCSVTNENPARDRHRGVAEGLAHAPDASGTAADSRADCDTGGKQRRPIDRGEVADRKEHRHFTD
jgi:hypothetical protein